MKKMNRVIMRTFAAMLVWAMVFASGGMLQAAEAAMTVSQTVDHNLAVFSVKGAPGGGTPVSILVMQKGTKSIVYMDQTAAAGGEARFSTLLPKGEYTGYVSAPGAAKVLLQDFSIEKEEKITGFKALKAVAVAKGARAVLPSSVIAVFDSGANREVGVQWPDAPGTETPGEFTLSGVVNGTAERVALKLIVSGETPQPTPTDSSGEDDSSSGGAAPTPKPTPSASPGAAPVIKASATLDGTTAKVEVAAAVINSAFSEAAADSKGIKRVEIIIDEVTGAKAYEPELPASALTNGNSNQVIKVTTPVGSVELPGNLLRPEQAGGSGSLSISMSAIGASGLRDPALKAAAGDRPVLELGLKADGKAVALDGKGPQVKVSFPYKLNSGEQRNPEHLVVQYVDGAGNVRKIANTKYDAGAGAVTFTTAQFGQFALTYEVKSFTDGGNYPWAEHAIGVLASKGIIEGTSDTQFSPADNISRADFLVLLVRTLGLTADFTGNFSDTSPSDYYYEALGVAKKLGISEGADGDAFHPQAPITRQDLMVLSARALQQAHLIGKQSGGAAELAAFHDAADVASYASESIAAMVEAGIVTGRGDTLAPLDKATRAETAVIMYRIFNKL
ncbi:S-layer homology domain-containing protein [Paenibacillus sp. YN15]|uniref:S-layer homology domain-containing protein n=1 Tax=Paenibacillus sp. YN15 TaxID=1742774 RepID=UPI000DCCC1BB|nr:S-layer homology domain-containing protein [Paenibacillus sp. YN15]RAV05557.1 hypothetical protein DQG13_02745 [Paenibacillus sp. YN15]